MDLLGRKLRYLHDISFPFGIRRLSQIRLREIRFNPSRLIERQLVQQFIHRSSLVQGKAELGRSEREDCCRRS